MSSPLDPVVLLNILEPILDKRTGGVREVQLADRFVNVMRDARKLVQRCTYLNIFQSTQSDDIRKEIIRLGGWNILYDWLKEGERLRHWTFVSDILQLFITLPVSLELLRSNGAPKLIRRLSKRQDIDSEVRNLATDILSIWKDIVIDDHASGKERPKQAVDQESVSESTSSSNDGMTSVIDPNIDVEAADEPYMTASSATASINLPSFHQEGKSAQNANTHLKVRKPPPALATSHVDHQQPLTKLGKSDKAEKLNRKDIEQILKPQQKSNPGKDERPAEEKHKNMSPDKKAPVVGSKRPPLSSMGDLFGAALKGADETSASTATKRPKTVKTYRTTFRSTGLDQEPEPAPVVKKRKTPADVATFLKRKDSTDVVDYKHKAHGTAVQAQKSTSPLEKLKTQPAPVVGLPRSSSSDSNLLGDHQPILSPTSTMPGAVTSKSPKTVPKTSQMIESDSFMAALTGSSQSRTTAVIRRKKLTPAEYAAAKAASSSSKPDVPVSEPPVTIPKPQFYKEIVRASAADTSTVAQSASADTSATGQAAESEIAGQNGKKRVRWARDHELVQTRYFELEEGERAHKALGLNNSDLASLDKKMEREAMEAARRDQRVASGAPEPETYFNWKLSKIDNAIELVAKGFQSEEKTVQLERMKNVLADIYFSPAMIPETPKEPDMFNGTPSQEAPPRIIPLDDATAGPEPTIPPSTIGQLSSVPSTTGTGQTSLPPELAQLLQNLNKSGLMPPGPQTAPAMGMPNFTNAGPGYGQQPAVGFGMGQPGMGQPMMPQFGPGGMPTNQQQGMGGPMQPNTAGMMPQMPNTGPQQMFPNMMQQGQPQFGPPSGGLLPPPSGPGGGWNNQMMNPQMSNIRQPVQNGGGFRGGRGGPPGGFGQRGGRFQGPRHGNPRFERVCPFFQRGKCTYGDNCRYKHADPPTGNADSSPRGDPSASPPNRDRERDRDRDWDRDRDRARRYGRSRFRSPPPSGRFDRRHGRSGSRDRDRERDRGDKDYRSKVRSSQPHMSPTYSPVERYRSSPPAQIMDASPVYDSQPAPPGTGPDTNGSENSTASTQDRRQSDQNDSNLEIIADTPASP